MKSKSLLELLNTPLGGALGRKSPSGCGVIGDDFIRGSVGQSSGASGRPFLVNGDARVAEALGRGDWRSPQRRTNTDLHPDLRAELAVAWTRMALVEHASIAAFARFNLQLLSLGAPADLVERSSSAMCDEIKHAKLCFAEASRYAGRSIGPGPLSIAGSLDELSLSQIVLNVVREGCIGETIAAVEALEAHEHAADPALAEMLLDISLDETRHAELAWRFVKWSMASADAELVARIRDEFAHATLDGGMRSAELSADDTELLTYGVIPDALRPAIRARAIENVVAPCARALLSAASESKPKPSANPSC
jgi:hypothetical protein